MVTFEFDQLTSVSFAAAMDDHVARAVNAAKAHQALPRRHSIFANWGEVQLLRVMLD